MKTNDDQLEVDEVMLLKTLNLLSNILEHLKNPQPQQETFYDNADLKRLLNLSDSALHRLRKTKKIPFRKIGGKVFYPQSYFNKAFKY